MPAGVELLTAYVSIVTETSKVAPEVKRSFGQVGKEADRAGRDSGKRFAGSFGRTLKAGAGILGVGAAGAGLVSFFKASNAEAREAQKVGALTNQVLKSTGGVANVSAKQVGILATAISNKVGIDDEAIQSGENLLLTFKNVRNEAGKGNNIFDQATHSIVDMAAAMAAASGGEVDFRSATTLVGKALNDPVKGLTALSRVGVTFTEGQKKQIKALVESGHQMKAQKVILKELKSEFGGAAKSQATEGDKARVAIKNLEEQIGTGLLPVVDKLATFTSQKAVPAVSKFVTGMQDGTGAGGDFVDVLEDARDIGKGVLDFFDSIPGPVKKYGAELLIASLVIGKMNTGLGVLSANTKGFVKNLGSVEGSAAKLQAVGAGLRNIAGAGGMLLIADSSKRASTGMSTLEAAAGGALSGAALGAFAGPPGAVIGAALGGLGGAAFSLGQHVKGAGREAKISLPPWKDYAQTLKGVSEATTQATRDMAFQRLESSGLLAATREIGLTDRQAVNAMLGQKDARQKLAAAMRNQNTITNEQKAALERETGAVGASRLAQLKHNIAIADSKKKLREARQALRDFMKEPAAKRLSITGIEDAKAQLSSLQKAIRQVWGAAKDANVAGSGGLNVLLNPKRRAMGGPVTAGQPYIVGDRNTPRSAWELFVPNQPGRIMPRIPTATSGSASLTGQRVTLSLFGQQIEGIFEAVADSRVDSAAALAGMNERAFG